MNLTKTDNELNPYRVVSNDGEMISIGANPAKAWENAAINISAGLDEVLETFREVVEGIR